MEDCTDISKPTNQTTRNITRHAQNRIVECVATLLIGIGLGTLATKPSFEANKHSILMCLLRDIAHRGLQLVVAYRFHPGEGLATIQRARTPLRTKSSHSICIWLLASEYLQSIVVIDQLAIVLSYGSLCAGYI